MAAAQLSCPWCARASWRLDRVERGAMAMVFGEPRWNHDLPQKKWVITNKKIMICQKKWVYMVITKCSILFRQIQIYWYLWKQNVGSIWLEPIFRFKWAYESNNILVQKQQHNSWAINGIWMSSPITLTEGLFLGNYLWTTEHVILSEISQKLSLTHSSQVKCSPWLDRSWLGSMTPPLFSDWYVYYFLEFKDFT